MITVRDFMSMFCDNFQNFKIYDNITGKYLIREGNFSRDIPKRYWDYEIDSLDCVDSDGAICINISFE